jgi:serine/threonine protein kinase
METQTIAGRFRVERPVGQGAMGAVWLGTDEKLSRQVALKRVISRSDEPTDHTRLLREARSLAALNHRNVVAVYDAVEEGDQLWLVMEYIPGRSLADLLEQGPLSLEDAVRIGAQVADGLAAAHERGLVHRDVKPANILVTDDGVAKIGDFGIAMMLEDPRLTASGLVTGTPSYFAPELARGEEPTAAADVWALGATLYAAVEGHALFPGHENALALLNEIASQRPPQPERAGFLTEPIMRALDQDPVSRWSMADLAHVLRRLEDKHAKTHTRISTAAFAAGGNAQGTATHETPVAAAATPTAASEPTRADPPTPQPEPPVAPGPSPAPATKPRPRRTSSLAAFLVLALLVLVVGVGFLLLGGGGNGENQTTDQEESQSGSGSSGSTDSGGSGTSSGSDPSGASPDAEQFVGDYYAALPEDTRSGWSSLTPGFQDEIGSYGDYQGFWRTISSVEVTDTRSAGDNAVDVDLTYTKSDGSSEDEARRIYLEPSGDDYLISGDEVR